MLTYSISQDSKQNTIIYVSHLSLVSVDVALLRTLQVCSQQIPLTNLRVVRGNNKFTYTTTNNETYSYSFYVHSNCPRPDSGVEQLLLDNLAGNQNGI